jgi:hypothetical protein
MDDVQERQTNDARPDQQQAAGTELRPATAKGDKRRERAGRHGANLRANGKIRPTFKTLMRINHLNT